MATPAGLAFRLLAVLLFALPALAQRDMGAVLGTVTDASGGVIPAASVTITEDATGVTVTLQSNAQGNFIRPLLKPGAYTVAVESPGFKRSVQTGIIVQSASRVQANFILEVGQVTEVIEVTSTPPALQTETPTMGGTLESRQTGERHSADSAVLPSWPARRLA